MDKPAGLRMVEASWEWTRENEVVRVGPPGCGKTHFSVEQMAAALRKRYKVTACSLTVTAAEAMRDQVRARGLKTKALKVGTLHKHCFELLGLKSEQVADSYEAMAEWNSYIAEDHPEWVIPPPAKRWARGSTWESPTDAAASPGEVTYSTYQRLRSTLVPMEEWDSPIASFHQAWSDFKQQNDLLDFVDMLGAAWQQCSAFAGDPDVIIADEAQDGTPLWWVTLRHLARNARTLAVVGDADQCLYQWTGAWPGAMFNPHIPRDPALKRWGVLKHSRRVPAAVRDRAQAWIEQILDREPVEYLPREGDPGAVFRLASTWEQPGVLGTAIEQDLSAGRSVMVLTACGYMLQKVKEQLRERGVPYGNKYRPEDGGLNPLNFQGEGTSIVDRLLAFLQYQEYGSYQSVVAFKLWTETLKQRAFLNKSLRATIAELDENEPDALDMLEPDLYFAPEDAAAIKAGSLDWLQRHMLAEYERPMRYAAEIVARRGPALLRAARSGKASVDLGTIYSVKGGEADCVYLFPDLSPAGFREYEHPATVDAIHRLFYVGMTRARSRLVLCAPSTARAVRWVVQVAPTKAHASDRPVAVATAAA